MIRFAISEAVQAACSLDRRSGIAQEVGLTYSAKQPRRGAAFDFATTGELRRFASLLERSSAWDLPPYSITACNAAAKRARWRAQALDVEAARCPRCGCNDELTAATNYGRDTGRLHCRRCNLTLEPFS